MPSCPYAPPDCCRRFHRRMLGNRLGQVHFAAKDRIVFDRQAQCANIAFHHAAGAQFHAATGHDVPWTWPRISISLAERSAATLALGPMVNRLSDRLTVPSTRPSTIKSSLPFTSPRITTRFADARWNVLHCHNVLPSVGLPISSSVHATGSGQFCHLRRGDHHPTGSVHESALIEIGPARTIPNPRPLLQPGTVNLFSASNRERE